MLKPVLIDLFAGLGGWAEGGLAEGYAVIGFDLEDPRYGDHRYPGQLVLQDVRTLHGSEFKDAALIVASPPCQRYSYMAMPWTRAKRMAEEYRTGTRSVEELNELFDTCFRIQREASEAAGRHIPLVVENVKGAQPWVGRAQWHFGSYYLWGDVPALMPTPSRSTFKTAILDVRGLNNFDRPEHGGRKGRHPSGSAIRKAASAMIAKIPFELARHIAWCYKGRSDHVG